MLPSWMKMHTDYNSEGAKFLDAVGKQLSDIESLSLNVLTSHHLDIVTEDGEVNIASIDVLYKTQVQEETISGTLTVAGLLEGVTYNLTKTTSVYDFYLDEEGIEKYYIDTSTYMIYTRTKFDIISVNDAAFTDIVEHNIWGPYDEIGLLLGCPRIPGERNEAYTDSQGIDRIGYRTRLYDVFINPGNSTRQGLINYLARSFSIDRSKVVINELDESFVNSLVNADGTIKAELKEYFNVSNRVNLSASDTYWDVLEENRNGLNYLPIIWDVSLSNWNNDSIQNGIGDENDIEISGPEQESSKQDFTYNVGVEGLRVAKTKIYPEHQLSYKVYATGQKYDDGHRPESYQYSVVASELVPLKFNVKAHKKYTHDIQQDFNCASTIADYTTATNEDKKTSLYVGKNVSIQPGSTVTSANARYVEVLANIGTSNKAATPQIASITLGYTVTGNVTKQIILSGNSAPAQTSTDVITSGFTQNTWGDTSPLLKVRSDTNDQHLTTYDASSSALKLTHGIYEKIYNSEGDWDDGEKINIHTTSNGTIKLSI
jgi:hypothetical protein